MKLLLLLFFPLFVTAQKGGIPSYPVITPTIAQSLGMTMTDNVDTLAKYVQIDGARIFISKSITLKSKLTITGKNVTIDSDKRSTISSKLFTSTYLQYESILIKGKNCTIRGLNLTGDDPDYRTLDTQYYQCGIRCQADSFQLINCKLSKWGWACLYLHHMNGARVEQCYFTQTKNNGYGYGIWHEGKTGQRAIIKDNIFENLREGIDAGGHPTYITIEGNVTDAAIVTHKNKAGFSAVETTVRGNYFYNTTCGYYPAADGGILTITDNFFTKDTAGLYIEGYNINSAIVVSGNKKWEPAIIAIEITEKSGSTVSFRFNEGYPIYEVCYGEGSDPLFTPAFRHKKTYPSGTHLLRVRGFSKEGIPTAWATTTVKNYPIPGIALHIKSSARFLPAPGYYTLSVHVDDELAYIIDAANVAGWRRIFIPFDEPGSLSFPDLGYSRWNTCVFDLQFIKGVIV